MSATRILRAGVPKDFPRTSFGEPMLFPRNFMAVVYHIFRGTWLVISRSFLLIKVAKQVSVPPGARGTGGQTVIQWL